MSEFSKTPSFANTPLQSPIAAHSFLLMAVYKEERFASGTAIVVAPNLAITAKHVIEDFWQKYNPHVLMKERAEAKFSLQAFNVIAERAIGIWDVTKLWSAHYHDLAFIRLTPRAGIPSDYKWTKLIVELEPPKVGERIAAFGYRDTKVDVVNDIDQSGLKVLVDGTTAVGEVIDVHPERRDSARLPFPCFQTNARFDGGMSGGPVFNDAGHLCGLVCSNLPPSAEGEEHVSYVSLLWPLMATPLDMNREGYPPDISYPAIELARGGFINARNWERISLVHDADGKIINVEFKM